MKIVLQLGRNFTIFAYLAYCRSEMDWNITIFVSAHVNQRSFLHML